MTRIREILPEIAFVLAFVFATAILIAGGIELGTAAKRDQAAYAAIKAAR